MKEEEKSLSFDLFGSNLCTYNSLIHVFCLVGKVKDVLIVWEELKVSGHESDVFTYRIFIQRCWVMETIFGIGLLICLSFVYLRAKPCFNL